MHNVLVSDTMIEFLAEKMGVDFTMPRNNGYMHADNEKGLFVEAVVDISGAVIFNTDATHYTVDDETLVETLDALARSWREQQAEFDKQGEGE